MRPASSRQTRRGWWCAQLFPELPAAHRGRPLPRVLVAVVVVLIGAAAALFRQVGHSPLDTVWGEDGRIVGDALTDGWMRVLLVPGQGYLNLYPRLVGGVAALLPLHASAAALAITCAVTLGLVVVLVYRATAGHLRSRLARAGVAAAPVLLPVAAGETLNNTVNAQWYLAWAAFWMLLWRPRSRLGGIAAAGVCFLAAMSHPLLLLLAPVAVARLVLVPDRGRDPVPWALLLGVALQAGLSYLDGATQSTASQGPPGPGQIGWLYGLRVLVGTFLGVRHGEQAWRLYHRRVVLAGALALIAVLVFGLARRAAPRRYGGVPLAGLALAASVAWFVEPLYLRGTNAYRLPTAANAALGLHGRYAYLPALFLLAAVAAILDARSAGPDRYRSLLGITVVVVLALGWVPDLRMVNLRSGGPSWRAGVVTATATCQVYRDHVVDIPQSPPPGWFVRLPCRQVLARR